MPTVTGVWRSCIDSKSSVATDNLTKDNSSVVTDELQLITNVEDILGLIKIETPSAFPMEDYLKERALSSQHPVPSMTMIMVPEEEWRNLHDTLEQIIDLITRRNFDDSSCEWIESEEARKLLGISPKTWQNYRDQRLIPLSQIGRKIYVNRADLDDFLRSHQIAPKK